MPTTIISRPGAEILNSSGGGGTSFPIDYPLSAIPGSAEVSKYLSAWNPIRYEFQRKDFTVTSIESEVGFVKLVLNSALGDVSQNFTLGDTIYFSSDGYIVDTGKINGNPSFISGNTVITLDVPFRGVTETGNFYLNNLTGLSRYFVTVSVYNDGNQLIDIKRINLGGSGYGVVEVQDSLRPYLSIPDLSYTGDYQALKDSAVGFYIRWSYTEGQTTSVTIDDSPSTFFAAKSVSQNGDKYGQNLGEYVSVNRDITHKGKFCHAQTKIRAWQGYPFSMTALIQDQEDGIVGINTNGTTPFPTIMNQEGTLVEVFPSLSLGANTLQLETGTASLCSILDEPTDFNYPAFDIATPSYLFDGAFLQLSTGSNITTINTYPDGQLTTPQGNVITMVWNTGDDVYKPTFDLYLSEDGVYTFSVNQIPVVMSNGATCSANFTYSETINVPNVRPTAAFTTDVTTSKVPFAVSVDASTSTDGDGTIVSYAWDFGDGGTATGVTASHTYTVSGSYTITLTVTDNEGGTDTATQAITANPNQVPVVSNISITTTEPQEGQALAGTYTFTDPDGDVEGTGANASLIKVYSYTNSGGTTGETLVTSGTCTGETFSITLPLTPLTGALYLKVEITPKDSFGAAGTAVKSAVSNQVIPVDITAISDISSVWGAWDFDTGSLSDVSGNSKNLTLSGNSGRTAATLQSSAVNGKGALRFEAGVSDTYDVDMSGSWDSVTFFIVMQEYALGASGQRQGPCYMADGDTLAARHLGLTYYTATGNNATFSIWRDSANNSSNIVFSNIVYTPPTGFNIHAVACDTTDDTAYKFIDDGADTQRSFNRSAVTPSKFIVGSAANFESGARVGNFDIAYIAVFEGKLGDYERLQVKQYLKDMYAL